MENVHNADETAPGPETTQISVSDIANFDPLESAQPFAKYLIFLNWFDGETQWVIGRFWSLFWPILPNWFSGWWQYISGAGRALMDDPGDEIGEGAPSREGPRDWQQTGPPPTTIYQGLCRLLQPKHSFNWNGP